MHFDCCDFEEVVPGVGNLHRRDCLRDLCTADMEHRAISRGFSGRDLGKLFNISVTRGEQSGDDSATLGSELPASLCVLRGLL